MTIRKLKQLKKLIRANTRNAWLFQDPTADCFDHDDLRMQALLDYIETGRDPADVKPHLIRCSRCRYIYAITALRKVAES